MDEFKQVIEGLREIGKELSRLTDRLEVNELLRREARGEKLELWEHRKILASQGMVDPIMLDEAAYHRMKGSPSIRWTGD